MKYWLLLSLFIPNHPATAPTRFPMASLEECVGSLADKLQEAEEIVNAKKQGAKGQHYIAACSIEVEDEGA